MKSTPSVHKLRLVIKGKDKIRSWSTELIVGWCVYWL